MTDKPVVDARHLSKSYGHVRALRDVSIRAYAGEVLAVVGDNGAGKSTLVKVLSGTVVADEGEILIGGHARSFTGPKDARAAGISTVFQDLALVEALEIASNLFLAREPHWGPFVRRRALYREAEARLAQISIAVPSVKTPVGLLSGGQRQGVAVARAVLQGGQIIIMDEPTAALGVQETEKVEQIIQNLRSQGTAVILVSHDLELVFRNADRIHVQRLGACAGVQLTSEATRQSVVSMITGASVTT